MADRLGQERYERTGAALRQGGLYLDLEWGYVFAFAFFIVMMFVRPEGLMARRS